MNYSIVKPVLIAFFVSVILSPVMIRYLHKLKFGQFIRGEGPESHLKKSGTPTMGGLIILLGIVVASLFYVKDYPLVIPILFVTLGFGFIGFIDDYIKVVMKRNLGLRAWQKMLGQILVTGIFAYYLINYTDMGTSMLIPFTHGNIWIRSIFCSWNFCDYAGNGKRRKFYGWSGWSRIQCNSVNCNIFTVAA